MLAHRDVNAGTKNIRFAPPLSSPIASCGGIQNFWIRAEYGGGGKTSVIQRGVNVEFRGIEFCSPSTTQTLRPRPLRHCFAEGSLQSAQLAACRRGGRENGSACRGYVAGKTRIAAHTRTTMPDWKSPRTLTKSPGRRLENEHRTGTELRAAAGARPKRSMYFPATHCMPTKI